MGSTRWLWLSAAAWHSSSLLLAEADNQSEHEELLSKPRVWFNFLLFRNTGWLSISSNKMANKDAKLPEFILEKEFQCHNTALIKDVVCKTIQKFVKSPQDVRLAITVSFQPHTTSGAISHEQEAIAVIQVDKPGNFYPGGQEQRQRDKELETLRQVEKEKQKERREMRKLAREEEDRKRRKMEQGVKRPPGSINDNATGTRTSTGSSLFF
ncbi:hypothetical protein Y032_0081g1493 [Ancylostoma ceylanicum]|uniref:Uncharacterized protein n=1 Tax=Ancylostoma ceylanicum TaxID=53326 RepID=A0A016TS99_9BILA|nr:hypothetical protein Y032_0081g1493 [Ancylostoma ceylanicum]